MSEFWNIPIKNKKEKKRERMELVMFSDYHHSFFWVMPQTHYFHTTFSIIVWNFELIDFLSIDFNMSLWLTPIYHQSLTTCHIDNGAILFENYCGSKFRAHLVSLFEQQFLHFKHTYTHFHRHFYPHVF